MFRSFRSAVPALAIVACAVSATAAPVLAQSAPPTIAITSGANQAVAATAQISGVVGDPNLGFNPARGVANPPPIPVGGAAPIAISVKNAAGTPLANARVLFSCEFAGGQCFLFPRSSTHFTVTDAAGNATTVFGAGSTAFPNGVGALIAPVTNSTLASGTAKITITLRDFPNAVATTTLAVTGAAPVTSGTSTGRSGATVTIVAGARQTLSATGQINRITGDTALGFNPTRGGVQLAPLAAAGAAAITIAAKDGAGNPVAGARIVFACTFAGGQCFLAPGATDHFTVTDAMGMATNLFGAGSTAFPNGVGALITAGPNGQLASGTATITATLRDFPNAVATTTLAVTGAAAAATPPATAPTKTGSTTIAFVDGANQTGVGTAPLNVMAGDPALGIVTSRRTLATPVVRAAGAKAMTVRVLDAAGNPVVGVRVFFTCQVAQAQCFMSRAGVLSGVFTDASGTATNLFGVGSNAFPTGVGALIFPNLNQTLAATTATITARVASAQTAVATTTIGITP